MRHNKFADASSLKTGSKGLSAMVKKLLSMKFWQSFRRKSCAWHFALPAENIISFSSERTRRLGRQTFIAPQASPLESNIVGLLKQN